MVNKMSKKRKLIVFAITLALMGIVIYGHNSIYSVEPFFSLYISNPEAPVEDLPGKQYDPLRFILAYAPVALDAKKRIYILGRKGGKAKILLLNQRGEIERIITPRLKDGRFLKGCSLFSISPSGNHIWTGEWEKSGVHRITVHDDKGNPKQDWLISGYATVELLLNSYSEYGAYVIASDVACFHFEIGKKEPQEFKIPESIRPLYPIFFHDGRYWGMSEFGWLIQQIGEPKSKKQIAKPETKEDLFGIATWSPKEGLRLVSEIEFPRRMNIQWVDEKGNFYDYVGGYRSIRLPSFLKRFPFLVRMLKAFGISEDVSKPIPPKILIFSPKGKILDVVPLFSIIRPRTGGKLKYGQLVKVDETGIYLEVVRVSEGREWWVEEYHIVRIVRKPRWKVWWERLIKRD